MKKRLKRFKGFTLIELMIVVAILGILASIAYPSYQRYIINSNRTAAVSCLLELAQEMERGFTSNMRYLKPNAATNQSGVPNRGCVTTLNQRYTFTNDPTILPATEFRLIATPIGPQANDNCGALTINHRGQRTAAADVRQCWGS